MKQLLTITILFILLTQNSIFSQTEIPIKQTGQVKYDTLLVNIQEKINSAFTKSLTTNNNDSLTKIGYDLEVLYKTKKQNNILYWRSYLQFYTSLNYLINEDSKNAEKEIDKGIGYLEKMKMKNSEDFALLAMLQGFSIQFKGMQAMFIGPRASKNVIMAISLDSMNLRAYYVFGSNDFYTPEQYGGGKKTEKYLLKAISLPTQQINSNSLPSWGKEEAYEVLIKLYIQQKKWEIANKYYQEGISEYPKSYIINQLASKLNTKTEKNTYPFKINIRGKGNPIILIPGLTCTGDVWEETVDALQKNYECHILSLAGFSNQKPIDINNGYLPIIQNKISEYIKNKMDKKPIIIGHSLGGFLALSIASTKPNSVEKIVLVDSYPFLSLIFNPDATEQNVVAQANKMKEYMISTSDSLYSSQQELTLKTMITDSLNIKKVLKWSIESDRGTVAQAMFEIMTTDLRDELINVKVPVLVLGSWYGYKDYGVTKEIVYTNLQNQFSETDNCTIKVAGKAKHFIMWDESAWFINEVKIFLNNKE